jgi:hypothetical protein
MTVTNLALRHKMQLIHGPQTGLPPRPTAVHNVAAPLARVSSLSRCSPAASKDARGAVQIVASTSADAKHASDGFFVIDAPPSIGQCLTGLRSPAVVCTVIRRTSPRCELHLCFGNHLQEMQTLFWKCLISETSFSQGKVGSSALTLHAVGCCNPPNPTSAGPVHLRHITTLEVALVSDARIT